VNTGIAVQDHREAQPLQLYTSNFWKCTELLDALYKQHKEKLLVVIEDPNQNRSLYARFDDISGNKRTKIAQNIGANKAHASLLLEFCTLRGIATEAIAPLGKIDNKEFAAITGITHGSQHARDAARLILGR
jgi:hypothetical protein